MTNYLVVLRKAKPQLIKNLEPRNIVRNLVAEGAIDDEDEEIIKAETVRANKVERMVDILRKKPKTSYDMFMVYLQKERSDLYAVLHKLEHVETGELLMYMILILQNCEIEKYEGHSICFET